ncbi:MAG: hypothetical protein ACRCXC_11035 [Legionella sp.]
MNKNKIFYFLILLSISFSSVAEPVANSTFWQCTTHDATDMQWSAKSIYQKIALNFAFFQCKKNSKAPKTCKTSKVSCEKYINSLNVTPSWVCTALDRQALAWRSNRYPNRDDAALAAKAFCRQNSAVPGTFYINMVTCINKNEI